MDSRETAKGRYEALRIDREPFLITARQCSALTIPSLIPPDGHNAASPLPQPYQGLGSRGVLSLSARLTTAFLPPGGSVMRLSVPAEVLAKNGADAVPPEIENMLARTETIIHGEIERKAWRTQFNTSNQHLLVAGNVLAHLQRNNKIRLYRLDQYVVIRDPAGTPVEIIIREEFLPVSLPKRLQALITPATSQSAATNSKVALYTWARRVDDRWLVHQELEENEVPDSKGTYKLDRFPFLPLRYSHVLGESYGRGKIEEHYADLKTLDDLTKSIIEGSAMASRMIPLIRPNASGGAILAKRLSEARNGDPVVGHPDDVNLLTFPSTAGLQFTAQVRDTIASEVGAAFLLNSAMRRDAERVTAYELRTMIEELEGTLGGIYSTLTAEKMKPLIDRLIVNMQDNKQLPDWPQGSVDPQVLTGLDALGRERDVQRVVTAAQLIAQLPEEAQFYPKWDAMIVKLLTGLGLPAEVRTPQEVQQMKQEAMVREAAVRAAPNAVNAMAAPQQ